MRKKSILLLLLAGGLLTLASFTHYTLFSRGDVDEDGKVDIGDVSCLIDHLLSGDDTWGGSQPSAPVTETFTVNGVSFKMVAVEGGRFAMGTFSDTVVYTEYHDNYDHQFHDHPHYVFVSDFCIGETEVTQELWKAVMGTMCGYFRAINGFDNDLQRPVESASWDYAYQFIDKLNELTGRQFRLPTEAEWEYAARGGNQSRGYRYSGSSTMADVAWNKVSGGGEITHAVATKAPNELGLYDMTGNVSEWCQDRYAYYLPVTQVDPCVEATGSNRVWRGGSWNLGAGETVLYRGWYSDRYGSNEIGLRLAL